MPNRFYDMHFHAYNLSHPNLTAFADRLNISRFKLFFGLRLGSLWALAKGLGDNVFNLLSLMDNNLGDYFLYVEHFLKAPENGENFSAFSQKYDKIVLCPLVVDFGLNKKELQTRIEQNIFYKLPPQKPVVSQVYDLFQGIKFYYEHNLKVRQETVGGVTEYSVSHPPAAPASAEKLFEIYPFMGINPQNYEYEQIESLLEKYFSEYSPAQSPTELHQAFFERLGTFDGNVLQHDNLNFLFAGIKLYPPLGFDPWPAQASERRKAELIYDFCQAKKIPITTHCSTGGFTTIESKKPLFFGRKKYLRNSLANPTRWRDALRYYPDLKLNFAHWGVGSGLWRQSITEFVKQYPNVFTDFSAIAHSEDFYQEFGKNLKQGDFPPSKMLFGSDFMINLLNSDSYNQYLKTFFESPSLSDKNKDRFAQANPERFLFGGRLG